MQQYRRWFSDHFAVLVLGVAVGLFAWNAVGAGQTRGGEGAMGALDAARVLNAVDIIEIDNLESEYTHVLDAGRIDLVDAENTPTGGRGRYYQDALTSRLHIHGTALDLNDQPIKDFPGCVAFGPENTLSFLFRNGGGSRIRPHVEGFQGAPGYPGAKTTGMRLSRHVIINRWIRVTGNTAKLHDYYGVENNSTLAETDLVRTAQGWKFHFRKVISPRKSMGPCTIANPTFPLPADGSLGAMPTLVSPS